MVNIEIRLIIFSVTKDGEALCSQEKRDQELTVTQIMKTLLQNSDLKCRKWASLVAQLVKNPPAMQAQFSSWVRKIPWRRDRLPTPIFLGFPGGSDGKEFTYNAGNLGSVPGSGKSLKGARQPTPVFLPGKSPWKEEPGGLQFTGLQRVGHN